MVQCAIASALKDYGQSQSLELSLSYFQTDKNLYDSRNTASGGRCVSSEMIHDREVTAMSVEN